MYVAKQLHAPTVSTKTSCFSDAHSCCSAFRSADYRSPAGKWGRCWGWCRTTSGCEVDASKTSQSWSELTRGARKYKNKYVHAVFGFSPNFPFSLVWDFSCYKYSQAIIIPSSCEISVLEGEILYWWWNRIMVRVTYTLCMDSAPLRHQHVSGRRWVKGEELVHLRPPRAGRKLFTARFLCLSHREIYALKSSKFTHHNSLNEYNPWWYVTQLLNAPKFLSGESESHKKKLFSSFWHIRTLILWITQKLW